MFIFVAQKLFSDGALNRILLAFRKGVTTYALHPDLVATEFNRYTDESLFRGATQLFRMFRM